MRFDKLIQSGQITLTLYTPEAIKSGLINVMDQYITERTGLELVFRSQRSITDGLLHRFYENGKLIQHPLLWKAINQLFSCAPCIVSLWQGPNAVEKMLEVKGATHPAEADPNSIRGRFWCDSPLCNLIHSSDSPQDVSRELSICFDQTALDASMPDLGVGVGKRPMPVHSGIMLFHDKLRALSTGAIKGKWMGSSDKAAKINKELTTELLRMRNTASELEATLITAFIEGDGNRFFELSGDVLTLNTWESLILACSMLGRSKWNQKLVI